MVFRQTFAIQILYVRTHQFAKAEFFEVLIFSSAYNLFPGPWECHSFGNSTMGMSFLWESHGMGQHAFVFPMRLRNTMRVSECY